MPKIRCGCGARFSFTEKSLGKKGKCARCGEILTLQADNEDSGIIPLAEEPDYGASPDDSGQPTFDTYAPPVPPPRFATDVIIDPPETGHAATDFASQLLDTVLFIKDPHNFVVYALITSAMCLIELAPPTAMPFTLIGKVLLFVWFCAFRFDIIERAAAGDDKIPGLACSVDRWDSIIQPAVRWFGTWFIVLLPAAALALLTGVGQVITSAFPLPVGGGGNFFFNPFAISVIGPLLRIWVWLYAGPVAIIKALYNGGQAPIAATIVIGYFLWPMVALCVSLGGFASLLRFDLIIKTVVATLPAYLFTLAVVYGTATFAASLGKILPANFGVAVMTICVSVYLQIVAMRTIGLHYYFLKGRYAWSWG